MIAKSLILRVQLRGFRLESNDVFLGCEIFGGLPKSWLYELRDGELDEPPSSKCGGSGCWCCWSWPWCMCWRCWPGVPTVAPSRGPMIAEGIAGCGFVFERDQKVRVDHLHLL